MNPGPPASRSTWTVPSKVITKLLTGSPLFESASLTRQIPMSGSTFSSHGIFSSKHHTDKVAKQRLQFLPMRTRLHMRARVLPWPARTMDANLTANEYIPKRGSRPCPYCTTHSSNRAFACKSCHRRIGKFTAKTKQVFTCDVSSVIPGSLESKPRKLLSVRVRDRGPDFRTFVTENTNGVLECSYETCRNAQDARQRSQHVHVTTQTSDAGPSRAFDCEHIRKVRLVLAETAADSTKQQEL